MNKDDMRKILHERLETFRSWPYAQLADRVERDRKTHDCLEFVEGTAPDGTQYQMEFNAIWDDKPRGDVRVIGDFSKVPQSRLWGFLPISVPDVVECFILSPDGRFVDEESENSEK